MARPDPGAPTELVELRRGAFFDSVTLMLASRDALAEPGVQAAAALAATPLNLGLLREQGFHLRGLAGARPADVVVALRADGRAGIDAALEAIERRLAASQLASAARAEPPPRSFRSAVRRRPELNLALISVPGAEAAYECAAALEAGLHVFCFSDGVSIEDEAVLKRMALERGLLLMGPECGTAIVDGVGLGFANAVRPGPVGIAGASGTGIQALCCLLDYAGVGISQALGVGGRDLAPEIGGAMMGRALELLAADDATEAIALVGKASASPGVAGGVAAAGKPVIATFVGTGELPGGIEAVASLEAAAMRLCELVGAPAPTFSERLPWAPRAGALLGAYCGGTLCDEAAAIATGVVASRGIARAPGPGGELEPAGASHVFIDFGATPLTRGRPHPMIDPSLRAAHLEREAARDEVAAVVVDVVLGRGAHPDPAGAVAAALEAGTARRTTSLAVVAAICGTERDPQGLMEQVAKLEAAGAVVTRSSAHAVRLALAATGEIPAP